MKLADNTKIKYIQNLIQRYNPDKYLIKEI